MGIYGTSKDRMVKLVSLTASSLAINTTAVAFRGHHRNGLPRWTASSVERHRVMQTLGLGYQQAIFILAQRRFQRVLYREP